MMSNLFLLGLCLITSMFNDAILGVIEDVVADAEGDNFTGSGSGTSK